MKQIPMLDLKLEYEYMKDEIDKAIKKCLDHQHWILGPEVKELEEKVASYLDMKNCIGVSSGTDALVLSLRALSIKLKKKEYFDKNDWIITTPFTFTATGDAILRAGATPVFIDIDPETYNIDTSKIKDYLNSNEGKRVIGIVPVHLYGQSCEMDKILKLAKEFNLFIVEDVAQAFGGMWKGKKLGSIGELGAFSFFPSKNLGCFGDGGMVSTSDNELAEIVKMLLKHGGKDKYNVNHIGYNARLDTLQASVLITKIKYIDEFNEKRREIAECYKKGLSAVKGITIPEVIKDTLHVFHQYTIRVNSNIRTELQNFLTDKGISTMVYYPFPLNKMKVFENKSISYLSLDNAKKASEEVLSLPIEPLQKYEDTNYIIDCLNKFFMQ
ncbi:MAG: DegT/DnrJ/EryC1/StrS family aminotransferase [bacterium]